MPQLASRSGQGGFFTSPQAKCAAPWLFHSPLFIAASMVMQACVRTLGELVAKNAIDDPQLVSAEEAERRGGTSLQRAAVVVSACSNIQVTQMLRTMRYILDSAPHSPRYIFHTPISSRASGH